MERATTATRGRRTSTRRTALRTVRCCPECRPERRSVACRSARWRRPRGRSEPSTGVARRRIPPGRPSLPRTRSRRSPRRPSVERCTCWRGEGGSSKRGSPGRRSVSPPGASTSSSRHGAARRVVDAGAARNATWGPQRLSAYHGSVPFGTLARGDETLAMPSAPFPVLDDAAWSAFWLEHSGGPEAPEVDFDSEMVIVGAVGPRAEAGDSVEVRRILPVDIGTLAHVYERIPGDFCSPVARRHYPFHIVVSPRTPSPIQFAELGLERVPCGG